MAQYATNSAGGLSATELEVIHLTQATIAALINTHAELRRVRRAFTACGASYVVQHGVYNNRTAESLEETGQAVSSVENLQGQLLLARSVHASPGPSSTDIWASF